MSKQLSGNQNISNTKWFEGYLGDIIEFFCTRQINKAAHRQLYF